MFFAPRRLHNSCRYTISFSKSTTTWTIDSGDDPYATTFGNSRTHGQSVSFGSATDNRNLSGLYASPAKMLINATDLPEPVSPATRACGCLLRSQMSSPPPFVGPNHTFPCRSRSWNLMKSGVPGFGNGNAGGRLATATTSTIPNAGCQW